MSKMADYIRAHRNTSDNPSDVWDEGEDGKWAVLKPGLASDELHTCHEYTWGALLKAVRAARPCDCQDCQDDLAREKKEKRAEEIRREVAGSKTIVYTEVQFTYPGQEPVWVPVTEAFAWTDAREELWGASMVRWHYEGEERIVESFAKSWWFGVGGKMARIGDGAYGDGLVIQGENPDAD